MDEFELGVLPNSDLARFLAWLKHVGYIRREADDGSRELVYVLNAGGTIGRGRPDVFTYRHCITLFGGVGYPTFYSEFYFTETGTFLNYGAWE